MTLTRKSLKAMGIEDEKIDQIIDDHSDTVDALKKQRDDYKAQYEAEHEAFEAYKAEVEAAKHSEQVKGLYRDLLKEAGVDEKRIETVLRVTDLSKLDLNKDGTLKDAEGLKKGIAEDWSDFIATTEVKGADVETPPANTGGKMSKEDILAIKDPGERQAAIAENHEAFGF